ncbi:uncharacterized protein LOC135485575 [Lineus longissimus]|uniref:uncharacterized protein LOC135485575 n=1 Tax=Lineus longissimus TaxID=88925 RepID=UPI002B4E7388
MAFLTSFLDNPDASKPKVCNTSVKGDVFLLVDITNNLANAGQGVSNFIQFLKALINRLTVGGKAIRIGIIFYDDRTILVSNLTYNVSEIQQKIAGMQSDRDPESSNLYQALKFLLYKGFKKKVGSRPVPRIGLIISSEWPNVDDVDKDAVLKLKSMGVRLLYAGDKGKDTMTNFVSKPAKENMFFLSQYGIDAIQSASVIASKICGRLAKFQSKRTTETSSVGAPSSSAETPSTSSATATNIPPTWATGTSSITGRTYTSSTEMPFSATAPVSVTISPRGKKPISHAPDERTLVTPTPEAVNKSQKKPVISPDSLDGKLFVTSSTREGDKSPKKHNSRYDSPEMAFEPNDQTVKARMMEVKAQMGFLPNALKVFARRPAEFKTFFNHHDTLMADGKGNLTKTDKEMIAIATGAANKCVYCVIQHSAMHRNYSKNPLLAEQIATNWKQAELNSRQKSILRFAMAVCHTETITEKHFKDLEKHGLTKEDAWDIGAITAFYSMENRIALVANVKPNREFYAMGRGIKST